METTALTASNPPAPRQRLVDWLWNVSKADQLNPQAKLTPLLYSLPPPEARPLGELPHISGTALGAFELQPVQPERPPGAAALVAAGAPFAAAAPEAAPKNLLLIIWELAHRVHDHFTSDWPNTWPRPQFANDPSNPKPSEWKDYADQLSKAHGCKLKLEEWQKAPETPPRTREALSELISRLGLFVSKRRKKMEEERERKRLEEEERARRQAASSFEETRQRDLEALKQRFQPQLLQLERRVKELLSRCGKNQKPADPMKLKFSDNIEYTGYLNQISQLQLEFSQQQTLIMCRVPPPGVVAEVGGEARAAGLGMGLRASGPDVKRPRL